MSSDGPSSATKEQRRYLTVGALLVVLVCSTAAVLLSGGLRSCSNSAESDSDSAEMATASSVRRDSGVAGGRRWQPGTAQPQLRQLAQQLRARQHSRPKPTKRMRFAFLFDGNCHFGSNSHCKEWQQLTAQCDGGDAAACVRVGDLLITQSPMQPLWGAFLLESACKLGRRDVCERAERWLAWSKFGYQSGDDGTEVPDELAATCASGNHVACGLIELRGRNSKRQMDEVAALAACRAGFRDVCTTLMAKTKNTATILAAGRAGCDLPDARICMMLAGYYASSCVASPRVVCPPPDDQRALQLRKIACRLQPKMSECSL